MYTLSLLWQIPLGVALLALAWFFFSLAFRLGSTLKMIEMILDKQLGPLLEDVNQTVEGINQNCLVCLSMLTNWRSQFVNLVKKKFNLPCIMFRKRLRLSTVT